MKWKKVSDFLQQVVVLSIIPILSFAAQKSGIGGVASNMMEPVSVLTDFVHSACLLLGGIFFLQLLLNTLSIVGVQLWCR